jgi:hypothetical protein
MLQSTRKYELFHTDLNLADPIGETSAPTALG